MTKKTSAEDFTDNQLNILKTALENPDMSHAEIAVETELSESYVRTVRNKYEDQVDLEENKSGGSILFPLLVLAVIAVVAFEMGLI